jgi:hypothetical protein
MLGWRMLRFEGEHFRLYKSMATLLIFPALLCQIFGCPNGEA